MYWSTASFVSRFFVIATCKLLISSIRVLPSRSELCYTLTERKKIGACSARLYIYYCCGRERKIITDLNMPKQCPLVLMVEVGWKQGKASESEDGVLGNGLLVACNRGMVLSIWAKFRIWTQ